MQLVVGLGNPGGEYRHTRHNIGMMVLDEMLGSSMGWKSKFKADYMQTTVKGEKTLFLKPLTFMNLSGESVRPCMDFFKVDIQDILIIHDELDLPFGTAMFKQGGGLAGHNGLKSIAQLLGTQDFKRLRLGIGRPQHGDVSSYVLGKFSGDEGIALGQYLQGGEQALNIFIQDGFTKAAEQYNKKSFI